MAYPEPIPAIRGKSIKQFEEKLDNFALTPEQVAFYKVAKKRFGNSK